MKALCAVGGITFLWAWLPGALDAQQLDLELGLFAGWGIEEPYRGMEAIAISAKPSALALSHSTAGT